MAPVTTPVMPVFGLADTGEFAATLRALADAIDRGETTVTAIAIRSMAQAADRALCTLTVEYAAQMPPQAAPAALIMQAHEIDPVWHRCAHCGLSEADAAARPDDCASVELEKLEALRAEKDLPELDARIAALRALA